MKTAEQILACVNETIDHMLKRPMMFAVCSCDLEVQVLGQLTLLNFIISTEETMNRVIINKWFKFAHNKINHSGPLFVSGFLKKENALGENWEGLTNLLTDFVTEYKKEEETRKKSIQASKLTPEEINLIRNGRRIDTIRSIQKRLNCDLGEAKRIIDTSIY